MVAGVFPALPLTPVTGGLLSVAQVDQSNSSNPEWSNGVFSWDSWACPDEVIVTDLCNGEKSGPVAEGGVTNNTGWPLGIVFRHSCYTMGLTIEERRKRVREQVEAGTSKALERELQTAEARITGGRFPPDHHPLHYLADSDATVVTPGPVSVVTGVAALEQALADCGLGVQGVIHMPRGAAQVAVSHYAVHLHMDGPLSGKLFTGLGTPVAAGSGYTVDPALAAPHGLPANVGAASPPKLVAPGPLPASTWIYATGPVAVKLSAMEVLDERIDRRANMIDILAARAAAVYWDSCCHFAAEVNLS